MNINLKKNPLMIAKDISLSLALGVHRDPQAFLMTSGYYSFYFHTTNVSIINLVILSKSPSLTSHRHPIYNQYSTLNLTVAGDCKII